MYIFGFQGANAPIQLHVPLLTYDFTMAQGVILLFITTLFASFLMTGICVYLSSAMRKPISVLAISVIIILLGMFNGIAIPGFEKVRYFLPSSMGTYFDVVLKQFSWRVFGVDIMLYQAVCIVAFAVGTALISLTYRHFKRHQVA